MPDSPAFQLSPRLVRIAGFLAGVLGSLVLMAFLSAIWSGGLSDGSRRLPPVYIIE